MIISKKYDKDEIKELADKFNFMTTSAEASPPQTSNKYIKASESSNLNRYNSAQQF